MWIMDHLVVACERLEDGVAWIEERLGVATQAGGHHVDMGTHNRLLSLGPNEYLEVIAVDPEAAAAPNQPRWFDLDRFKGAPRLTHWAARVADLNDAPVEAGQPWDLKRGDLQWRMAIPSDGILPFSGRHPGLLEWQTPHPAPRLEDKKCRLQALRLEGPQSEILSTALKGRLKDQRVTLVEADTVKLSADIKTPGGIVTLSA